MMSHASLTLFSAGSEQASFSRLLDADFVKRIVSEYAPPHTVWLIRNRQLICSASSKFAAGRRCHQ